MNKRVVFIFSILVMTLTSVTAVHAFSIEGHYGPAYSYYELTEGDGEYHEIANWNIMAARGTLALAETFNVFGEVQMGKTTDVDVIYGAAAANQSGTLNRYIVGSELTWQPNHMYSLGGGVGYLVDEHTHVWDGEHPGGPGTPPFSPGDTLHWTWKRSVSGALILGSVNVHIGWLEIEGRLGYSPAARWEENTEARLDNDWETWEPEESEGVLALYEVTGNVPLAAGFSLQAGAQGVSMQSSKAATYEVGYANSDGLSFGHTAHDLPAAQDHMLHVHVGLQYRF